MDSGFSSESSFPGTSGNDQAMADEVAPIGCLAGINNCCQGTDDDSQSDVEAPRCGPASVSEQLEIEVHSNSSGEEEDNEEDQSSDEDDSESHWSDGDDDDVEICSVDDGAGTKGKTASTDGVADAASSESEAESDEEDEDEDGEDSEEEEEDEDDDESVDDSDDEWDYADQVCEDDSLLAEFQLPSFPCPFQNKPMLCRSLSTGVMPCSSAQPSQTSTTCPDIQEEEHGEETAAPVDSVLCRPRSRSRSWSMPTNTSVKDFAKPCASAASTSGDSRPAIQVRLEKLKLQLEEKRERGFMPDSRRHSRCCNSAVSDGEKEESPPPVVNGERRVRFMPGPGLVTVHTIVAWNFAYRAARVADWAGLHLDELRFRKRIDSLAPIISPVLSPLHRSRCYTNICQAEEEVDHRL